MWTVNYRGFDFDAQMTLDLTITHLPLWKAMWYMVSLSFQGYRVRVYRTASDVL